ncbi:SDR family oxidoreductase [Sphingomonas cannabina]|uniref:SDR family oxidoreductase n=1 Tax=Sphingomonas cannabina TaxID=2899123 RepID=UPI001F43C98C|nr:SDR family oxidoreductase [Sphingomonas cannabina]UIJ45522.1 SDR family oxidoreductase [Sphingomonas cannabina]
MKIVVIGGTGLIGSKIVASLVGQGHDALAAAPNTGVNTLTGEGLDRALDGSDVVVDVSNSPSFDDKPAMDFFLTAGRNIAAAEKAAGVRHHVALSVVGTDRLQDSGYFRAKQVQEWLIKDSGIPWTLLYATQFFEFLRSIAQSATEGDLVRLPLAHFQPIAAQEVAATVVETALARPIDDIVEVAGPEVFRINELVARLLRHDGDPRRVVADPEAPYFGVRLADDTLLPGAGARLGAIDFDRWIANLPSRDGRAPVEVGRASHALMVSRPDEVAAPIEAAAGE